jgi:hypothetical protein
MLGGQNVYINLLTFERRALGFSSPHAVLLSHLYTLSDPA